MPRCSSKPPPLRTGGPSVGKLVLRAASENLTPVTLELGGKCPALVTAESVEAKTVRDLLATKTRNEIFGRILPVVTYRTVEEAIEHVNAGERPLALYVYSRSREVADRVLERTCSGGACVNGAAVHATVPSLPFGGIGFGGMGHHHGVEGFLTFSASRACCGDGRRRFRDEVGESC